MKRLTVEKPSTFFSSDSPVKVYDRKKNIFYFHPNREKHINFNLPEGYFFSSNTLTPVPFRPYKHFEGANFTASGFKIIVEPNPYKATISPKEKTITIDPEIANPNYLPCLYFVLGHELGHLKYGKNVQDKQGKTIYNAESFCDSFATSYMLAKGFNPSQIAVAKELILSDGFRKACVNAETIHEKIRR